MKLSNPTLFCLVCRGQEADSTAGAQTCMHSGRSYRCLDDIVPPPADDMINDIGEESDDDGETRHTHPRGFPTTKTVLQEFQWNLQIRFIRQQRQLQFIRKCALGLFADHD